MFWRRKPALLPWGNGRPQIEGFSNSPERFQKLGEQPLNGRKLHDGMLLPFAAACLSALDTNLSKAVLRHVRAETYLAWYLGVASVLQLPVILLYHAQLSPGLVAWGALLGLLSCAAAGR